MKINDSAVGKTMAHKIIPFLLLTKLSVFIILLTTLQSLAHTTLGQGKINLSLKNVSIETVLKKISDNSDYNFVYKTSILPPNLKIDVVANGASIDYVMAEILKNTSLEYKKTAVRLITIVEKQKPLHTTSWVLHGTVINEKTDPVAGASIAIKGSPQTTLTDIQGKFIIEIEAASDSLVVTFVGYKTKTIAAGSQKEIVIQLEPDFEAQKLGEVVIVGFGEQKKKSLVAAVATVTGEQLRMPTRSLSNNLAGQIPGLIAVQRSGEPGYDNAEFWIRGTSSFAGGTRPLVLVDGVPRNMNDIEPDEIETFTLLKDAAATAVYGAEGANGVVLITSKRGKLQKTAISYRGEYSAIKPTRVPRFANSVEYLTLYNEALRNEGKQPAFSDETIAKYASGEDPDLYPSSNWYDIVLRDHTWNTRHTLNFRGGTERARFFVSGAYFQESGIYKSSADYNSNAGLKRYNLRSNVDLDITKTTLLRVDISGQYLQTNYPANGSTNLFERFSRIPPHLIPPVYSDGTIAAHPNQTSNRVNPYAQLTEYGYTKEWRSFIQSRVDLEQKLNFITRGLRIRGAISYDANSTFKMSRRKTPASFYATGRDADGKLIFRQVTNAVPFGDPSESNEGTKNIYMEAALDYNRTFIKHSVSAMLLTYQKERQEHDDALAFRKQAYVGRITYGFDNRYSIEGNFGITGSENFAAGYRYGFFPAVGVAWNLTSEPYFPTSLKAAVSGFKIRASIGRTGNDNTGGSRFLYNPTFNTGSGNSLGYSLGIGSTGPTNGLGGLVEGRFAAPFLSWEIEIKRNIGIDASFLDNKIAIQADYFNNYRSDILLQRRTLSAVAGFREAPWQNFGQVSNKGVDGSLTFSHTMGDLSVILRGNFTYARNKIIEYDEVPQLYPWLNITGTRLNALNNMLVADGLFKEEDFDITTGANGNTVYTLNDKTAGPGWLPDPMPGDIKYKDLNGDGVIDDFDRVKDAAHPVVPEIIYGFGANLGYKGFYVSVFFQGAGNASVNLANQGNAFLPFHWGLEESNVRKEIVESRWTQENPSQDVFFPRLRVANTSNTSTYSTWWIRNGAFLRLKNVEAGYNFTTRLLEYIKMKTGRIYVMGQNVALWDKVKVYDPELGNSAGGTKYPIPIIWTAGIEFTF
ncbi:MAG: SusC/RagA family TonB-linked outer membrane protein [Agriterribacter sp.]